MLFSMFVSLPTGQVSGLFSFRCLFRTGPDRVFRTVLAVKRLFSFSSANFYIIASFSVSVNSFFYFFKFFFLMTSDRYRCCSHSRNHYSYLSCVCQQEIYIFLFYLTFPCLMAGTLRYNQLKHSDSG